MAREYTNRAVDLSGDGQTFPKLMLAQMLQKGGDTQASAAVIDDFERATLSSINSGHEAWFYPWNMAYLQALRGNRQEALDWYEQAVEAGRRRYEWDELEPAFVLLRDEPRFQAALENQRQQREDMHARVAVMLKNWDGIQK